MKINIFWFRRDLRLDDNTALNHALADGLPVLCIFIFDNAIIEELPADDPRITFIQDTLSEINTTLLKSGSSLLIMKGEPAELFRSICKTYDIKSVFINKDYEPYAISRDKDVEKVLGEKSVTLERFKDQVIFEEREILKSDGTPYTIFTPYKNQWLKKFVIQAGSLLKSMDKGLDNYYKCSFPSQSPEELNFRKSHIRVRPFDLSVIGSYDKLRDIPSLDKTSYLGPHLRFGTVSIRKIVSTALSENQVFLSELIWREFFMQILFNFPKVVTDNFRSKYDHVPWMNNEKDFERWANGLTGFPMVDAGMRQLNETGYMHNRVRMITAGFLCKHLLIDWRWGETYFAMKLLDYELSSNNGNWQWAAGTGCDAAQYFRVFNPFTQQQRFDKERIYITTWIKELDSSRYPKPMVDHDFARKRVISAYKDSFQF